ncbi:MAG: glycosyltransferase family 4 protein [Elusimicrobiales bacterium]|jgi:glycosyltransferase involved in cell wall biosynthesis
MKNDQRIDPQAVLYISGFSDIVGGGQLSFLLLLKHLDRSRFRPVVLCPGEGEVSRVVSGMGIETSFLERPAPGFRRWRRLPAYVAELCRVITKSGARLVHCDTLDSALLAGAAARFLRVPLVFHARVADGGGVLDRLIPFFCSRIICVSGAAAERFEGACCSKGKVRVIHNGVDLEAFSPLGRGEAFRRKYKIPAHSPLLGYCGQLVEGKGPAVLIDAFKIIKGLVPGAVLALAGRGTYEPELRRKVREYGLEDSVIFAGFVEDTPEFMSALDVFAFPSAFREGFSRVLLEAMAAGKPVIAAPLGGNIETIAEGETGLFFQAGSASDLARKAVSLLKDGALAARLGGNGRGRAERFFDIRGTAEKIHRVYEELMPGPVRAAPGLSDPAGKDKT